MWLFWTSVSKSCKRTEEAAMHRRFLFPLAAGVVGLVAISPVFAAEPSPAKAKPGPAKATTTSSKRGTSSTMADSGSGGSAGNGSGYGPDYGPDASSTTANTAGPDSNGTTGSSTDGKGSPTPTTATSAPSSGPGPGPGGGGGGGGAGGGAGSSSSNCAPPQTDQGPAPQVGEAPQNHGAGDAGNVDVERLSPTELRIAKVTPNDGWMQQVTAPSGPRVTVKFTHPGGSPSVIRFAASMDQAGRVIPIPVPSCG